MSGWSCEWSLWCEVFYSFTGLQIFLSDKRLLWVVGWCCGWLDGVVGGWMLLWMVGCCCGWLDVVVDGWMLLWMVGCCCGCES